VIRPQFGGAHGLLAHPTGWARLIQPVCRFSADCVVDGGRQAGSARGKGRVALAAPMQPPYLSPMTQAPEIALTPAAAARVAAIATRQGKPAILRLAVEGGGCAGFSYRFGLADSVEDEDLATERDGVTLVVDEMTHDLVRGGEVDFVESLGGAAFQVRNPNAASGCGCGSSFSI
jgi:iron-sulfur cluster insertion protein